MKRRDLERHLRANGYQLVGEGANHAKWRGPSGAPSAVPRHSEIASGTARAICRQLRIDPPSGPR
ncbi:MAG: addiction module toxin, HicA family [Solirubrobacterales bacterium]|nr:MAG: addiction module toxin, HicA family [Solirubrobacterales bacterium]